MNNYKCKYSDNFKNMMYDFDKEYQKPSFVVVSQGDTTIIDEPKLRWTMLQVAKNNIDYKTLHITCKCCNTVLNIREDGCIDNDCKDDCKGSLSNNTKITMDMLQEYNR